jgi:acyl-CoA thioesterase FadM
MKTSASIRFPVRGNEIGFMGHISPGGLARYCEWARWAAALDPAYALAGKLGGGVARAQTLAITGALRFPGDVVVRTSIERVGRTSLDFGHELARAEDGAIVARTRVTVVQLGPSGPAPLPDEVRALAEPTGAPAPLEAGGPAEGDAFTHRFVVRPSDLDQFGHVNQAKYVDFLDDARLFAARAAHPAGFDGPLGACSVEYEREVRAGEEVEARLERCGGELRRFALFVLPTGSGSAELAARGRLLPGRA